MTSPFWLALLAVHLGLVLISLLATRGAGYTAGQIALQTLLALLVPFVGAIVVIFMARDVRAPNAKPEPSGFDRDDIGSGV